MAPVDGFFRGGPWSPRSVKLPFLVSRLHQRGPRESRDHSSDFKILAWQGLEEANGPSIRNWGPNTNCKRPMNRETALPTFLLSDIHSLVAAHESA